jgi:hypothetical protein
VALRHRQRDALVAPACAQPASGQRALDAEEGRALMARF